MPSIKQELAQLQQQRENEREKEERKRQQKLKEATALFESLPGWPGARVRVHEATNKIKDSITDEEKKPLTEARLEYVIRQLDVVGKEYVPLISDLESHKAFAALLYEISMNSWVRFSGVSIDMVPPRQPIEERNHQWTRWADRIMDRAQHWIIEGLRRLDSPQQPDISTPEPRRGYRQEINEWMKREGLADLEQARRRLGVSIDILKSIRSDKGRLRCSDETLARVLEIVLPPTSD